MSNVFNVIKKKNDENFDPKFYLHIYGRVMKIEISKIKRIVIRLFSNVRINYSR